VRVALRTCGTTHCRKCRPFSCGNWGMSGLLSPPQCCIRRCAGNLLGEHDTDASIEQFVGQVGRYRRTLTVPPLPSQALLWDAWDSMMNHSWGEVEGVNPRTAPSQQVTWQRMQHGLQPHLAQTLSGTSIPLVCQSMSAGLVVSHMIM
jgi:hypothetical protein